MVCWSFGKIKIRILKVERRGALWAASVCGGGMEGDMGTDQGGGDIGEDRGGQ